MSWLDNVPPKIKCWWMLIDYIKATICEFISDNNKIKDVVDGCEQYTRILFLNKNTFYNDHQRRISFEHRLKIDGIFDLIEISYGESVKDYAVKIHLKNDITDEQIEYAVGFLALMGHVETLNDTEL